MTWLWSPRLPTLLSFLKAGTVLACLCPTPGTEKVPSECEVSGTGARRGRGETERAVPPQETEMEHLPRDWTGTGESTQPPVAPKAGTRSGLSSVRARGLPVSSSPAVASDLSMTHSQLWAGSGESGPQLSSGTRN